MKLGMCLVSGSATQQGDGALLSSFFICSQNTFVNQPSRNTWTSCQETLSNQRKQTVSGYKDDSVVSECTSEGTLQGDRECNTKFLHVLLSLIK